MKSTKRIFIPGSEWMYFKIYAGYKSIENILVQKISLIIRELKQEELVEKWFFVRYADPDSHLRIRLLLKNKQDNSKILDLFYMKLSYFVKHNLIRRIQLDTYNRELERYGNNLIEEAETIFFYDSECMLSIVKKLNIYQNEDYRWMIALKSLDGLLSDFSFDLHSKQELMNNLSFSFKNEFGFNQYNSKQFNVKFRNNKNVIENVLNNKISNEYFSKLCKPIKERSEHLSPVINTLHLKMGKHRKNKSTNKLLSSYIHMSLNRLFISKSRLHELVLYDFLKRYYTSEIAKNKYNQNMTQT